MNTECWFVSLLSIQFVLQLNGLIFLGGTISWRPINTNPSGSTASVLIRQRYTWVRSFWPSTMCNDTSISSQTIISSGTGLLTCYFGNCVSFTNVSSDVSCTDYSATADFSSGERYDTIILPLNYSYTVGYSGSIWANLAIGGNGDWQITGKIGLFTRPDGKMNTSPITSTVPIIYRQTNVNHVHVIQMLDADTTDILRCRWANTTGNPNNFDECGSVCSPTLPNGFVLIENNCTLFFKLQTAQKLFGVAIQIEDYYSSSSLTPMSSIPIQFLFFSTSAPGGCSTQPTIIGQRRNQACIGTPIGIPINETVIAKVNCVGKTIVEFTSSSPIGLRKSEIANISIDTFMIKLDWIPIANQYGPQQFCTAALDSTNVQSDPWCITFLVGFSPPNLQPAQFVQGSVSPVGTIFSNHSIFSIQSVNQQTISRPKRNNTLVRFHDSTLNGTIVLQYDSGWSPNIIYNGPTLIIYAPFAWQPGHFYYVTFDEGVATGTDFCGAESAALTDPNFWVFDIWNPIRSSTMTTMTTSTTTTSTQTQNTTVTTSTPSTSTTTTSTTVTSTSTTTITTTTITTTTTTTANMTTATTFPTTTTTTVNVIYPSDMEIICLQPIAIINAIIQFSMIIIHGTGIYVFLLNISKKYNTNDVKANKRRERYRKIILFESNKRDTVKQSNVRIFNSNKIA